MGKKIGKFLVGLILILLLVFIIFILVAQPAEDHPFFEGDSVMVMAHQGGKGLWPENTLYAFERAVEIGVDVLEMDIHSTADGVLVVMHDDTVDDTTEASGKIHDFSLDDLQELDAGYHWTEDEISYPFRGQGISVPALREIFEAFPGILMNVEIKQREPSIAAALCEIIQEYDREELTLVASFDDATIKAFREACPNVATSVSESEGRLFYILSRLFLTEAYSPPAESLQVPEYSGGLHVLTERSMNSAASRNMDVHVWTVNEEEDMRRMIDLGVNGIITDYPDKLLQILER